MSGAAGVPGDPGAPGGAAAPITVLLVDDHGAIRDGVRLILESQPDLRVLGEAGDGAAGLDEALRLRPDVVLLDVRMPVRDGIWAAERIARESDARVLMLTTFGDEALVLAAIRAGAHGFLLKTAAGTRIIEAVRTLAAGGGVLDPEVTPGVLGALRGTGAAGPPAEAGELPGLRRLTPREREVFRALAGGGSNRDIARALFISETTVKTHLGQIYAKLGAQSRVEAALLAASQPAD